MYFHSMSGLFFILLLLKQGSQEHLSEAKEYASLARQSKHWLSSTYEVLEKVVQIQLGDLSQKESIVAAVPHVGNHSLEVLVRSLCLYWMDVGQAKKLLPRILQPFYERAEAAGYYWLAGEAAQLLSRLKLRNRHDKQVTALHQDSSACSLVELIQPQESWELCLNALANLHREPQVTPL